MTDHARTLARAIESTRRFIDSKLLGLGRPDARYVDYPWEEMAALLKPAEEDVTMAKGKTRRVAGLVELDTDMTLAQLRKVFVPGTTTSTAEGDYTLRQAQFNNVDRRLPSKVRKSRRKAGRRPR